MWACDSHNWEEEEGQGVDSNLQPRLWHEVEVEEKSKHQVDQEGDDEEVAHKTLFVLLAALLAHR